MTVASAPARPAFLRIRDLTKRFGEFTALDRISLDVHEGEFVCFLGPSGCGKTTLLRAIAGLDPQTSGRIEQAGRDVSVLPAAKRDFGIVFQSYALFPNLTAARNVAYGLENARLPRGEIRKRVRELLEMVGLPEQGDKYPAQLSGGSSSASPSRGPSRPRRACSSWTSPCRPSTRRCGSTSGTRSGSFSAGWG